jgi:hypothetical protein
MPDNQQLSSRKRKRVKQHWNRYEELAAIHKAAHAVMAARLGMTVSRVSLDHEVQDGDYFEATGPRPRHTHILILLAGHEAELRMADRYSRYRQTDPYQGVSRYLTDVFGSEFKRANEILAEPKTWEAVMKVADVLLKRRKLTQQEFATIITKLKLKTLAPPQT